MKLEIGQRATQQQTQYLSQQMWQSLHVLCFNAEEMSAYLTQQYNENPMIELQEPKKDPYARIDFRGRRRGGGSYAAAQDDSAAMELPAAKTFRDYLMEQLDVRAMSAQQIRGAKAIIECLDADGYLRETLEDLSAACAQPLAVLEQSLRFVQELDPVGVGARGLGELLWLKAGALGLQDETLSAILQNHLIHVAAKSYGKIAQALHITPKAARNYCDLIRSLDPRICMPYGESEYVVPDILVEVEGESISVSITSDYLPSISISPEYKSYTGDMSAEDRRFVREHLRSAGQVVRAVEQRYRTLEQVARTVVEKQRGFFLRGENLKPLRITDIAEALAINESTVSRAVQGKYLRCAKGVIPLKALFSRALPDAGSNASASADQALSAIRRILEREPSLSDQAVADRLALENITLARRTVAKYRAKMGISSTRLRGVDKA